MAEGGNIRVIICGDVKGRLGVLYKRISTIEKKAGKFDMLFCVGDFFGEECDFNKFADGTTKAPLETYVVGPISAAGKAFTKDVNGCELAENITYLGRRGIYNSSTGLCVAYLSGLGAAVGGKALWAEMHKAKADPVAASKRLNEHDLDVISSQLQSSKGGPVDLLLTAQWPAGVERWTRPIEIAAKEEGGKKEKKDSLRFGSALVSRLAKGLEPRYHVSATHGIHYERAPYRNHVVALERFRAVTRFVGLAAVKNADNQQYLFALKLTPASRMAPEQLIQQPDDVTENPYREGVAPPVIREEPKEEPEEAEALEVVEAREMEVQTEQFFYDLPRSMVNRVAGKKRHLESRNTQIEKKPRQSAPCWFCLSNPQVERHLVVSIGVQVYLSAPRGPLVPDHILIIPVGHHQSWIVCPQGVQDEIEEYKKCLRKFYKSKDQAMVVFERNFKSHHLQLQVVPVPIKVAAECKRAFLHYAAMQKPPLELQELPKRFDIKELQTGRNRPYFYVELPTGERLYGQIESEHFKTIDLQLGRAALSSEWVLGCPDRMDWKDCTLSKGEEAQAVEELRKEYMPFDFQ